MKKLRLRLEDLEVDAFPTTPAAAERGTVAAHSHETCFLSACPGYTCETCWETCPATCDGDTCHAYSCESACAGTCWEWTCEAGATCP
ncbi:MAG TPA: hypothetical protein VHG93_04190 [Longimicrobium sp.]|nr:hypothetical protein [Longimicrobium sp.]